jgi:excisionase family DNA binding protein
MHTETPSDTPELIDKARAAKILGIKERRVLQLVTQGKLEGVKQRAEGSTQPKVLLRLEDVRRYKSERDKPKPIDVTPPAQSTTGEPDNHDRSVMKLAPGLRDLAVILEAAGVRPRETKLLKPWLSLDEAEEASGLPASTLRALVEMGELPARDVGVRAGGRWRVKRADLDALQGVTQGRERAASAYPGSGNSR